MKKWAVLFLLPAASVFLTPSTQADGYCRSRAVYTTTYRQATYAPAAYVAPAYDYQTVYLKAVKAFVSPDYYSSVSDYYRDRLLVDAVAGRTAELIKGQQELQSLRSEVDRLRQFLAGGSVPLPQQQAPPAQPAPTTAPQPLMPKATSGLPRASEKLTLYVKSNCVRCHNGATAEKGIDLTNLDACSREVRLMVKAAIDDGSMPKGGKAAPDEIAAEAHLFATGRSGSATAQK